ncbi:MULTISPECIES: glycosyltransferase family 1 protein [unclassified Micromonospora]|uniref:glycosyltransferase family 4 protein n=1 Tax=unclassified Micromonospora TaxID=2617518 RepID=UPI001C23F5A3|nr:MULTISPECIES: glycosyltransferase family 1 protein [unclassified Micromonospora]MBU8859159.1 glycosyltransferase family 1 protein [Micromonospora sp. WMMB482]MDM4777976.1 glycosyltransferase family 1 protein [Micromonospora sp. b486]MDM4778668.1 glycosyltransferase family 1 protein [Micromonospora sp. b486]
MRIAIVTESFPPDVNGVAHSVVRAAEHLVARGHEPLVVAPAPAGGRRRRVDHHAYPVVRLPSVPLPRYQGFRLAVPSVGLTGALLGHRPDVVHLASPFVLGAAGASVAARHGLPAVAVYQTDVAAYARAYRVGWGEAAAWRRIREIHNSAQRTLAPSTRAASDLINHGVRRIWLWRRGVDAVRFHPARRSEQLRATLATGGELLVGYVGRLAPEKRVDLLAPVTDLPGVRVVVVGDGPARRQLERALPAVRFLGVRRDDALAELYASLDVFVHTGPHETFGQTLQEAAASGVPVVAPASGGPVDLVESGVTGLLVPPDDGAALAAAVAELAADPSRRARYGAAARAAVARRSWDAVGDELIGHYQAVLAGSPAAGRLAA